MSKPYSQPGEKGTDTNQASENELRVKVYNEIELWYAGYSAKDMVKQAILDWHNKQVEEVLDRIESKGLNEDGGSRYVNTPDGYVAATAWNEAQDRVEQAIEAERNKLKETV